jgi:hypothetical protein
MQGWFHIVTDYPQLRPPLELSGQIVLALSHRKHLLLLFGTYMLMLLAAEGIDYCFIQHQSNVKFFVATTKSNCFCQHPLMSGVIWALRCLSLSVW